MYSARAELSGAPTGADSDGEDPSNSKVTDPFAGAPAALLPALRRRGFEQLTDVQKAIAAADDGARDLRITSQTGSGKTVALGFSLLPGLEDPSRKGPTTLVIAPTRELAMQVKEELAWLFADLPGVTCEVVTGGTSIVRERSQLRRRPTVVVGTPGRLLDHLRERALDVSSVSQLVLDEADQMLDLGFKDELDGILAQIPAERRTHLVSATFPRAVLELANRFQVKPIMVEGADLDSAHKDIEHVAYRIGTREHYGALVNLLLLAGEERTLVFVRTREDTVALADKLASDGFATMPLNGDLAQAQRTRTLAAFRRGSVRALIATDVAARGLDIESVTLVVHVHLPIDSATYVHRSGRTGRAGKKGQSAMFVPKPAAGRANRIYREVRIEPQWAPVPGAAAVRTRQLQRAEAAVAALLDGERVATPAMRTAAANLIKDRDPVEVAAMLLGQTMSTTCEPVELREQRPVKRRVRKQHASEFEAPHPRKHSHPHPVATGRQGAAGDNTGFTRFRINWGFNTGADPRRILAHICRRGGIESRMVGAIQMQAGASTFNVGNTVAASFVQRVKHRDRRDPHLHITAVDSRGPTSKHRVAGQRYG